MESIVFDTKLRAPFPYFGSKRIIADAVWRYIGDVKQYIEPFFGSGAVLLRRPPSKHVMPNEIVCDIDGRIANAWRAIQFAPEETAKWCDWPVCHADLIARRKVIIEKEPYLYENLIADPKWYDPELAGYWIYCASCAFGRVLQNTESIPRTTDNVGCINKNVYDLFERLRKRIRYIKVVCGNWKKAANTICIEKLKSQNSFGVFLDPPYSLDMRSNNLYAKENKNINKEVEKWCFEKGKDKHFRIVLAGYEGEYENLVKGGWGTHKWVSSGGYSVCSKKGDSARSKSNRFKERLFISPGCLNQGGGILFDDIYNNLYRRGTYGEKQSTKNAV